MSEAVRLLPLLWPCAAGWTTRVLEDHGEGATPRYIWQDGQAVKPSELDRVAELVRKAEGEGEVR